jgi:hypothetical protein
MCNPSLSKGPRQLATDGAFFPEQATRIHRRINPRHLKLGSGLTRRGLSEAARRAVESTSTLRDTLENWQSEFLQLLWQVGGLALLLHLGSPQSKEGSDRVEEKIDAILRPIDPEAGDRVIAELDRRFERQPDDPPEHRFQGA